MQPRPAAHGLPPLPPHLDPRGRHRGGLGIRSGGTRILMVVTTLISVGLLVLSGYVWYTFRSINGGVTRIDIANVGQAPKNAIPFKGKDQNILLVGNDDRNNMTDKEVKALKVGRDGGSLATDTMMIVHIPADGKRATLISLPRDSYVAIKGYGKGKLNGAYADAFTHTSGTHDQKQQAGANLLVDTISSLTGLTINHYIQVDLLGFYRISNAIGGVPVTLCKAVDDTVAYNKSIGSDGGSGLKLSKGRHVIKGVQALEFVRQRHNLPGGDLDRVRRQQYFLTAAFRQVASVGVLTKLNSLGDAIKSSITLDPTLNLIDLGRQLENLTSNNITGKTIPTSEQKLNGLDVLLVNPTKVRSFINKAINPPVVTPSTSSSTSRSTSASKSTSATPTAAKTTAAIDAKCIN